MKKREKWLRRIVCLTVLATFPMGFEVASAAGVEEDTVMNDKKIEAPIIVDSRDLTYNNISGDLLAIGDVSVKQGTMTIKADEIRGNSKTHIVETDGQMQVLDPVQKIDMIGSHVRYNYQEKTGTMQNAHGKIQEEYITGEQIEMLTDKTLIKHGTTTKCPGIVPCWHVEANDAELLPDGRVIAHDATFFLKNKPVYHTSRYENDPNDGDNFIPSPGYNSSDGFYIKQKLQFPILTDGLSAFLNWGYYSRHGFKSTAGFKYYWNGQEFRIVTGEFQDSDDEWIKKKIEYQWEMFNRRIGDSKFRYRLNVSHGLWEGAGKQSWHDEYKFYLSHDPIRLMPTLSLRLGAGYQIIQESYDDSTHSGIVYDAVLHNKFSPKLSAWTGYHYIHDRQRLFRYDRPDLNREWRSGFRYSWNNKDAFGMSIRFDLDEDRLFEKTYFFEKDLHCWKALFTYEQERNDDKFKVKFSTKVW